MDRDRLKEILRLVAAGQLSEEEALDRLRTLPFADLGFAKVDHHRALRQGMGEVVFAEGKRAEDIVAIVKELRRATREVLVTRLSDDKARALKRAFPKTIHNPPARTARVPGRDARRAPRSDPGGPVLILSGGVADLPVVEEARETLLWLGLEAEAIADVGVAGIHRLFAHQDALHRARAIIVVAGMEGALTSVVGGMVAAPVIGVPTSIGYGAGAGGLTPLLGMLNSCAAGVTVVNIDNGFGAACAAARILASGRERP